MVNMVDNKQAPTVTRAFLARRLLRCKVVQKEGFTSISMQNFSSIISMVYFSRNR